MQHLNSYVCWEAKNGNRKQNQKKTKSNLLKRFLCLNSFFKSRWGGHLDLLKKRQHVQEFIHHSTSSAKLVTMSRLSKLHDHHSTTEGWYGPFCNTDCASWPCPAFNEENSLIIMKACPRAKVNPFACVHAPSTEASTQTKRSWKDALYLGGNRLPTRSPLRWAREVPMNPQRKAKWGG